VVVSLLLQNVWRYLHYEYVATPRRGGRRLWWWPYKEFVNMIRRAAWSVILSSRLSVQPLRHRTQAAETASRGCFVRY